MRFHAIYQNHLISLLSLTMLAAGFTACGLNQQDPAFTEEKRTVSIALTVDDTGDSASSDEGVSVEDTTQHLATLDDSEVQDILTSLPSGNQEGETDADAIGIGGDEDLNSVPSGDGSDSAGSETSADPAGSETSADPGSETPVDTADSETSAGDSSPEGTGEGGWGGDVDVPSKSQQRVCARINGVSVERVKIVGNQNSAKIQSHSVLAIKLAGNKSKLDLQLSGSGTIAGLCLFVTGNQGSARVKTSVTLGNFLYIGRGNRSSGDLHVLDGGAITNIVADLRGNQAKLSVHGNGIFSCSQARVRDKKGGFRCD